MNLLTEKVKGYPWGIERIKTNKLNILTSDLILLLLKHGTISATAFSLELGRKALERNIKQFIPELPPSRGRAIKYRIAELFSMGYCSKCEKYLMKEEFTLDNKKKSKLSSSCKGCTKEHRKEYRKNNWLAIRKSEKQYRTKEGTQQLRNKAEANRRARKKKATPKWFSELDNFVLEEMFELTRLRKKYTGLNYHVDHIIPLNSTLVCGLHWHKNWQILTETSNLTKGNKLI